jgi:hypothetical protein
MYESSIAFLRRSVVPRQAWENQEHEPTPRKSDKPGIASRRQQRKAKRNTNDSTAANGNGRLRPDKAANTKRADSGSVSPAPERDLSRANSEILDGEVDVPMVPYTVKAGPREQQESKKRWELGNSDLFADAASTLRGILGADAVAIYNMEDYSLFYRRTDAPDLELDKNVVDPANTSPLFDFMHGKPWPENLQPIVHHIPSAMGPREPLLGISLASKEGDAETSGVDGTGMAMNGENGEQSVRKAFDFSAPDLTQTLSEALREYLTKRRFWWQTHGSSALEQKVLAIVPSETQTLVVHFTFTFDGRLRTATFGCWNRPPAQFDESSTLSLPFMQILGGLSGAALSFRKVRSMEQSQISYSNLQAQ